VRRTLSNSSISPMASMARMNSPRSIHSNSSSNKRHIKNNRRTGNNNISTRLAMLVEEVAACCWEAREAIGGEASKTRSSGDGGWCKREYKSAWRGGGTLTARTHSATSFSERTIEEDDDHDELMNGMTFSTI